MGAPRGEFVLTDDAGSILLISAGVGVTPVLAMLHQLAALASTREVWWIHTARDGRQHPFADEAHRRARATTSSDGRVRPCRSGPDAMSRSWQAAPTIRLRLARDRHIHPSQRSGRIRPSGGSDCDCPITDASATALACVRDSGSRAALAGDDVRGLELLLFG